VYFPITEQVGDAHSGNVSTVFSVAQQAFQGFQELAELNLRFVKQTLRDGEQAVQRTLSGETPIELLVHQANGVRPLAERVIAHNREAFDIAMHTHAEILQILDAQFQQQQLKLREIVEGFARNAPAGSEAAVNAVKSAVSMSGVGFETIRKAAAQAIEMAQKGQLSTKPIAQVD
jgi:phasin family protein